jgi:hypothetical protein
VRFRGIDDRLISGNPYDESKWRVVPRGAEWVVLDALGSAIASKPTQSEAEQWLADLRAGGPSI